MRRLATTLALALVVCLVSCTSSDDDDDDGSGDRPSSASHASGAGHASLGSTDADLVDSDAVVSLAPSTLTLPEARDLEQAVAVGGLVGPTLEVSVDGELHESGVRLTRSYPAPLPEGAVATFVYYDPGLGAWAAVPSELSEDRTSITATVSHLSLWTDVVGGTGEALDAVVGAFQQAGEAIHTGVEEGLHAVAQAGEWVAGWVYYAVGKIFDTRVDAPTCSGPLPAWVDSTQQIALDKNNPILWCAGHDVKHPELLVVKGRVNRGFGFPYTSGVKPRWRHNSTFDQTMTLALDALVDQDEFYAKAVELLGLGPLAVGRGGELSQGFSESKVRSLDVGDPLVQFTAPSALAFLASVTAGLAGEAVKDRLSGWVGTVVALGSCARQVANTEDVLDLAKTVLKCVGVADEAIARQVAVAMLKARPGLSPKEAGKSAGAVVGRITIYLALVGPVFSSMNYLAEIATDDSARRLTAFPTTVGPTEVITLNPFEADGSLRTGYTLDDRRTSVTGEGPVDCSFGYPAVSGTTPNTHWCGTTADNTHECWAPPTYPDSVACLFTPWDNNLVVRSASGLSQTPTPADPEPMGLELADGSRWWVRIGGSWGGRADGYVGAYGCDQSGPCPAGEVVLLTDADHPAVDTSGSTWYVLQGELGSPDEEFPPPERLPVVRAYFIASSF